MPDRFEVKVSMLHLFPPARSSTSSLMVHTEDERVNPRAQDYQNYFIFVEIKISGKRSCNFQVLTCLNGNQVNDLNMSKLKYHEPKDVKSTFFLLK